MADGVQVRIDGMAELMAELRQLPQVMQQRIVRGAVGTGANIIKREVVALAPEWTGEVSQGHPPPGTLKRAIYAARLVDKCTASVETWQVGVRSGKGVRNMGSKASKFGPTQGTNMDAYYASWVEYGHYSRAPQSLPGTRAARRTAVRSGAVAGAHYVLGRPFLRPGFERSKGTALRAMEDYVRRNIAAAVVAFVVLKAA